ncbi:hypothetical protein Psi02_08950 [Planotetraspora silvatica]|uniref:WxL domain-containing protein n=1 Tax=Planotetraspora silvatica TaxID=234614 RepID=A0A8J3UHA6_9ACTN|nr:hypothetical protein [Planotetraspora silvatica]GII44471.1 hypothetical protein Psi02_08950 [Planotetraspora silvatica]
MRKSLLALAAGAGLVVAIASPVSAADTITTFTITAGALTITAPPTANLGTVASGATSVSAQLGTVTVTDTRGLLVATWTATVSSTAFTTGGGTPAETIANTAVNYSPGTATATSGLATFTPGTAGTLGTPRTAFTATLGVSNNSASWNPTVSVAIPAAAVAGTYTGTITHSVA